MSRYYDPVTHRFINADGYFQSGGGILDANTFAYCGNNPIVRADPSGEFWGIVIAAIAATIFVGSLVNAIVNPNNPISGASAKTTSRVDTSSSTVLNVGVGKVETGIHNDYHSGVVGDTSSKPITYSATYRADKFYASSANCTVNIRKLSLGATIAGDFIGFNCSYKNDNDISSLDIYLDPSTLSVCCEAGCSTSWDDHCTTTSYTKGSINLIKTGMFFASAMMGMELYQSYSPQTVPSY